MQWDASSDDGVSFMPVAGATSSSLELSDVTASMNGDLYEAVFTSTAAGSATTGRVPAHGGLATDGERRRWMCCSGTATSLALTGSDPNSPQPLTYTVTTEPSDGTLIGTAPPDLYAERRLRRTGQFRVHGHAGNGYFLPVRRQ